MEILDVSRDPVAPPARPYVLVSAAMSVDGHLDDTSPHRLVLSGAADLDRVDAERAGVDAILVGATTIRRDNPRLLVRSPQRRAARVAAGRTEHPLRVTLTASGDLDPAASFFGPGDPLVYARSDAAARVREAVGGRAEVVDAGEPLDPAALLTDLHERGVRRLMVEGGQAVHTLFLTAGLVDEIQLAVAPFFVGDPAAPRFVGAGRFPHDAAHRMRLVQPLPVGDVVVLRYRVGETDG